MIVHRFQQYTPEWYAAHRGRPSTSNFGRIITPKKAEYSKSADEYCYELLAEDFDPQYGVVEGYVNAAMKNGNIFEPGNRRYYEMERNCDVEQVGLIESDCGRFLCSPDGLVGDDGLLEIKSPTHRVQIKYLLTGGLPAEYAPQVHGQLLVTRRKWVDFLSYAYGLPPLLVRVTPNEFTVKLAECLEEFWKTFVQLKAKITGAGDPVAATRTPYTPPF